MQKTSTFHWKIAWRWTRTIYGLGNGHCSPSLVPLYQSSNWLIGSLAVQQKEAPSALSVLTSDELSADFFVCLHRTQPYDEWDFEIQNTTSFILLGCVFFLMLCLLAARNHVILICTITVCFHFIIIDMQSLRYNSSSTKASAVIRNYCRWLVLTRWFPCVVVL